MAYVPPYNLDPHTLIRDPETTPILLRRGVYDVLQRESKDSLHDRFMKAFNVVAKTLTDSGRMRLGTLELTPTGIKREDEVRRLKDTKKKLYWLDRWAKRLRDQDPTLYAKTWWQARDDQGET